MELRAQLDSAGRAPNRQLIFLLLSFLLLGHAFPQTALRVADQTPKIKELYDAGRWSDVVRLVPESPSEPADSELYRGLALAQLKRWDDAENTFEAGLVGHPRDYRFLTEMAGLAYRKRQFSQAKADLRRALSIAPKNGYANNFLASIYFLEGNLEAALKYWNRDGKPKLNDLVYDPPPSLDPLILDRAFAFSRGSEWRRDQFLTTQAELRSLNLFPRMRFALEAKPDGAFNLGFDSSERSIWGETKLEGAVSMLRGLPYESVYPEFYDLDRKGLNWLSFARWDKEKRRLSSEIAAPLPAGPKDRFRIYFDGRNENWNLTNTIRRSNLSPAGGNMERAAAGAEIQSIVNWRWQWNLGAQYSYRKFRSLYNIPERAAPYFTNGSGIALESGVQHTLVRFPERRFTLDSGATGEFGTFFKDPLGRYGRITGALTLDWLPKARGEDYKMQTMLRAGWTSGKVPLDDLFMLGFDRDNGLWMRGHDGLIHGKKGNAPLGRNFILSNSEIDKIVYKNAFFTVKLGPFLDSGDVYDPSGPFGSPRWLSDTGVQAKIGLLGSFEFVLGYGKDLRSGNNTFYTTVIR